jgi:4-hydroxybenzoate polyprenyltransferase
LTSIQQDLVDPLPGTGLVTGARVAVSAMRPRQWVKNLLLFAGILFAGELGNPTAWIEVTIAFAAFCSASSAAYLMNDLRDVAADRLHPKKRLRPIASGALSVPRARRLATVLAGLALCLGCLLGPRFLVFLAGFATLQVAYTIRLKRIVYADVATIALLFVIRAAAGAAAVDVRISPWLLVCTLLLALFLACAKRRAELVLVTAGRAPGRAVLARYSPTGLTRLVRGIAATIAVVYAAYAVLAGPGRAMALTVPFVVFGLVRYLHLTASGEGEEPERTLLGDPALGLCVVAWTATAIAIVAL